MHESNSLRVLHIVSSLQIGGAERFVLDLCYQQKLANVDASIMSFGQVCDPLVETCTVQNIDVYTINGNRFIKWINIYKIAKNFDVIHFHSPYPMKLISILLPLLKRQRIIYTRHGANPLPGATWRKLHRYIEPYVNEITFVSQEGSKVFSDNHGWSGKDKHVIDNGVDLDSVELSRKPTEKLRIGSVGRMVGLKNQISLLQAVKLLTKEEQLAIEVNFFGDGECLAQLQEFSDNNFNAESIKFHGMVSNRNIIYPNFDVLVVTSETEGLSLAIIEAMAYQCAVIATNVGGNPKLVDDNKNGRLFEYNDVNNLSHFLSELISNRDIITQFGQAGRNKIESLFSLEHCAQKYLSLYR